MAEEKSIVLKIETITDQAVMEAYGKTLNSVLGSYEENTALITEYNAQLKLNKEEIKATQAETEKLIRYKQGLHKRIQYLIESNSKLTKEVEELNKVEGKTAEQREKDTKKAEAKLRIIQANITEIETLREKTVGLGATYQEQIKTISDLTAKNEQLKVSIGDLDQITKNQIKVDNTEAGSMENKSQLLGKLRMSWRKMTDEQKNANQGMLQTIQQLDKSLKESDASIGNFQRNVGDYRGAIGDFIGQFPRLGGVVSKFAGPAGVISVATGAFNLLKSAMASTQTTGDALEIGIAAWRGTWDRFLRMIATADFSNFIEQLTGAYDAAKELAEVRDEMFEKENSIRLLKAEQSVEEQKLLMTMRDQTKSDQERIKAGQRYQELVLKNAQLQKKAYEELADAELKNLAAQTGATDENLEERKKALREWITEYATADAEKKRIELEALRREKQQIEATRTYTTLPTGNTVISNLTKEQEARVAEIEKLLSVAEAYNTANDGIISTYVNAQVKALEAESNAIASAQRAATTTNSLIAKEAKKAEKEAESGGEQVGDKVLEGMKKAFQKSDLSKGFGDLLGKSTKVILPLALDLDLKNDLKQGANKLASDSASPIKKALGLKPEEIQQIESQALQAAGQIFNSIAQLSNEATQRRLQDELDAIDKNAESEKAILEGKLEKGVISQKEYEKKLAEIDEQTAERKEQANKEAFEKQKKWNILQALMNAALAITKTFAEYGGTPMAWIMSAITAATTAAEIAVIASQKYARGGELRGASHAQGGIKGFVGNQHIEAEGGEVIINKRSSAKHRKLLSLINSDNGWGDDFAHARGRSGRFFARGGVIGGYDFRTSGVPDSSSSLSQIVRQQTDNLRQSFDAINRRIDNIRVYLPLSDIEQKSNEKRVHISRAVL